MTLKEIYIVNMKNVVLANITRRGVRGPGLFWKPPPFFFIKLCNRIFVESFMKNLTKRQYTVPDFLYSYLYNFFVNNLLIIKSFLSLVESTT